MSQVAGGGYTPPIAHLGSVPSASGGYPEMSTASSQSAPNQHLIHHSSLQMEPLLISSDYCVEESYVKRVARITPIINTTNVILNDFCEDDNFIKQVAQLYHEHCRSILSTSSGSSALNEDEIINLYRMVS